MPSRPDAPYSTVEAKKPLVRWKPAAAALLLALAVYIVWQFPTWLALAETGAAYGARIGCSCRYVQGREIGSCPTDFEPGMEMVSIEDLPDQRAVRASVPLLASRTARYEGATGCVLVAE